MSEIVHPLLIKRPISEIVAYINLAYIIAINTGRPPQECLNIILKKEAFIQPILSVQLPNEPKPDIILDNES